MLSVNSRVLDAAEAAIDLDEGVDLRGIRERLGCLPCGRACASRIEGAEGLEALYHPRRIGLPTTQPFCP